MLGPLVGRDELLQRAVAAVGAGCPLVVVTGEPGVGKTRFARELVRSAEDSGDRTAAVTASRSTREIPFGALSQLIGDVDTRHTERGEVLRDAAAAVLGADEQRLVLAVDDAHLLDGLSVTLLAMLARSGASIVLTHRTEAATEALVDLERSIEPKLEVELAPLDRDGTAELLEHLLGAPLAGRSFDEVWELSRGNPLYLHELALSLRDNDLLTPTPHGLSLAGPPPPTRLLVDIVRNRLGDLSPAQREVLETLALHEPLGLDLIIDQADLPAIEDLERRRLVMVEVNGRRRDVRLSHPVYGEVLRDALPRTTRERLSAALAQRIQETGLQRRDDPLKLALLHMDAGEPCEPEHLLAAARRALALFDHQRAEELARRAIDADAGVEAVLLLGEALTNLGDTEGAEAVLSDVGYEHEDAVIARTALIRSRNLLFSAGEASRAQHVVGEAYRRVTTPHWRDELESMIALCTGVSGDFETASAAGRRVRRRSDVSDRAKLSVLVVSTLADTLLGRLSDAEAGIRDARPLCPAFAEHLPFASMQLDINELLRLWHAGDLTGARRLGEQRLRQAVEDGQVDPAALYGAFTAMALLESGCARQALNMIVDSHDRVLDRSTFGAESTLLALAVRAYAALGDREQARGALHELRPYLGTDVRARIHGGRGRAWLVASSGRLREAAEIAATEGAWTVGTSHVVWGACTLYDAVRFGAPELVVDELQTIAEGVEGELVPTFAAHAEAHVAQDGDALEQISEAFAEMGALGYAAEAAGHAARAHGRAGHAAQGRRCSASAAALAGRCEGEGFPLLPPLTHDPLTPREHEIAVMAARGETSRRIAEHLVLSVRTVDNHLASIYRKTGVSGRHQLAEVISAPAPSE